MKNNNQLKAIVASLIFLLIINIAGMWYEHSRVSHLSMKLDTLSLDLSKNLETLTAEISSTTQQLQGTIADTRATLSSSISAQQQKVEQQLGTVKEQVGSLGGTLNTLQKLSKTDPELLAKYSKVFFLSENYIPERLAEIPPEYEYSEKKQLTIQTDVWPRLKTMIDDATKANVKMYAFSAYRSFKEQQLLKDVYTINYGAGTANSFSADQGYSEHQLGTALDIIAPGLGGVLDGFEKTPAYTWLLANAYKYGFILSYPKNNKYYVFEPWHWRFVGVKLATDLHNQGKNFYDLDQRTIDEYLVNIFD
jgi:zinc D-Ala-D-Ala carboxypeptidase